MGLRGPELEFDKKQNRILVLGDSFVEGVGASFENSWPIILDSLIPNYSIFNGGVSGSDPIFDFQLLHKKLVDLEPQLVILNVNESDFYDLYYRGGFERFLDNGTTKFKEEPIWLPIYEYAFVARFFSSFIFGLDESLIPKFSREKAKNETRNNFFETFKNFKELSLTRNFEIIVLIQPMPKYAKNWTNENAKFFPDLIIPSLEKSGLKYFNLYTDFEARLNANNFKNYYWPIDGHFNAKGYQLYAEIVKGRLEDNKLNYP